MKTCQFANPRNKSSLRSRPLGGSIAVIRCAPVPIGLSLYNTDRAVYNKKIFYQMSWLRGKSPSSRCLARGLVRKCRSRSLTRMASPCRRLRAALADENAPRLPRNLPADVWADTGPSNSGRARPHDRSCRTDAPHSHDDHGGIGNIIEFVAHSMVARSFSWPRRRRRAPCCRRYAVAGRGFVSTSGWKKTGFPVYAHSAGGYHESLNRRQRWRLP